MIAGNLLYLLELAGIEDVDFFFRAGLPKNHLSHIHTSAKTHTCKCGVLLCVSYSAYFFSLSRETKLQEANRLVLDWGLSQTTMEEVFLRLTHGDSRKRDEQPVVKPTTGFYSDADVPTRVIQVCINTHMRTRMHIHLHSHMHALIHRHISASCQTNHWILQRCWRAHPCHSGMRGMHVHLTHYFVHMHST